MSSTEKLFHACNHNDIFAVKRLFADNMFSPHVYQSAALVCVQRKNTKLLDLILRNKNCFKNTPGYVLEFAVDEGCAISADFILTHHLSGISDTALCRSYALTIKNWSTQKTQDMFALIDGYINDNQRREVSCYLDRTTLPHVFERIFTVLPIEEQKNLLLTRLTSPYYMQCVGLIESNPTLRSVLQYMQQNISESLKQRLQEVQNQLVNNAITDSIGGTPEKTVGRRKI